MNRYTSTLDVTDASALEQETHQMLKFQAPEFWKCEWKIRVSDSRAVRDTLVETLKLISRNMRAGRSWHDGIEDVILL